MLNFNKIYHTDCFEGFNNIDDNSIDIVFTSPPYNRKRNDKYKYYDDSLNWLELLSKIVDNSFRVLKDDGFLFLNIQKNYYNKVDYFKFLGLYAEKIVEVIIWGKTNPMPASGNNITNAYEVFVVLQPKGKSLKSLSTYTKNMFLTNVNSGNKYKKIHKAVMHKDASDYMFDNFIGKNKIVLDPFMGVGTTAISSLENNCSFIGFELHKEYVDLANLRITEYNNKLDSLF